VDNDVGYPEGQQLTPRHVADAMVHGSFQQ
jgi:hypothetical protein